MDFHFSVIKFRLSFEFLEIDYNLIETLLI